MIGSYTNMLRYYSLCKISSALLIIFGAYLTYDPNSFFSLAGWAGCILVLSGIILYIIFEEYRDETIIDKLMKGGNK